MHLIFFEDEKTFKSEQTLNISVTNWVNHIYDETIFWPNSAAMWCNAHGFDQGPGQFYWIGLDMRSFGIRTADYIIKCKNKETYDKYINKASRDMEHLLSAMKSDPNLNVISGSDVNTEFVFRWGEEKKTFNLHLGWDWYAEEKWI